MGLQLKYIDGEGDTHEKAYIKLNGDFTEIEDNKILIKGFIYSSKESRDNGENQLLNIGAVFDKFDIPADEVERIAYGYELLKSLEEYSNATDVI